MRHPHGIAGIAVLTIASLAAGCAAQPPSDQREVRLGDNLRLYDMYDNSRDWGPSFLVGPPAHHDGDQSRIDDTRLVPQVDSQMGAGAAVDPSQPPNSSSQPPASTEKPLPPVP